VVDIKSTIKSKDEDETLYQINPRTNRQPNQPSKKQVRKFLMAIFGVADQVPWWVGVIGAKGWSSLICCSGWASPVRSMAAVVRGGGSRRC
jgi:hypothetical protein